MLVEEYINRGEDYFGVEQTWVADWIEGKGLRILELGCGAGFTGAWLKRTGQAREVHGIELIEAAAVQAARHLDTVITGDIETLALPYAPRSFDVIVATEVLEHLRDPWRIVKMLKNYLVPNGYMIASVPNVQNLTVIGQLMLGKWNYVDSGIMDRTHLRYFTRDSFQRLFVETGFKVEMLVPIMNYRLEFINRMMLGLPEGFLTHRYKCRARYISTESPEAVSE